VRIYLDVESNPEEGFVYNEITTAHAPMAFGEFAAAHSAL